MSAITNSRIDGKIKILRVTTGGMFQAILLKGQLEYLSGYFDVVSISDPDDYLKLVSHRESVGVIGVSMSREISPLRDLRSIFNLMSVFKRERPDIVHTSTPKASLVAMIAAYLSGVRVRMHTPTGFRFVGLTGMKRKLVFFFEKLPFRFASDIYPESQGVINTIRKYNMTRKKVGLIGYGSVNGVNLAIFTRARINPDRLSEVKSQIGYDDTNSYILFVGRIVRDKGIEELVSAFSQLIGSFKLLILGPFEQGDAVSEATVSQIKNNVDIIHINWTDDVEYFMYLSTLLVHPSYREGLPNVLLQAGAMECPIICSAIEGNQDIVEDKKTGILFNPRDSADLGETLQYALSHTGEMNRYSKALRLRIEERFDHENVNMELRNTYLSLINKKL